ncbi:MAG: hypothetical protein A2W99_16970 [Bacteroidetes bacterium GWF2_33_16]|nr:MAG: hypothetical protein A2X00_13825 [Bacteroidetes bacterium GWE2_32_14]OFY03439.1 MAG: hypothetical protein A2W99_16970 [Bacteroidetes bacterium GWF2_33_16]
MIFIRINNKHKLLLQVILVFLLIIFQTSCVTKKTTTQEKSVGKKTISTKNTDQYYYTFLEANRQKLLGDLKSALILFNQCIVLNPESSASMHEIAQINGALNNYELAVKYAKMAILHNPENKWYYFTLAELYISTQNYEKAAETYEEIRKIEPNNYEVHYYLAMLYKQLNKNNEALKLFIELEDKIGINENISINKQQIYLLQGNRTKAYDEINKLINHFPGEAKYYGILAEMYTRDNLFLKAEENYKLLFDIDSINPYGQLSIVDYYRKKMDYDNAFLTIDKIIENDLTEFNSKVLTLASLLNSPKEFSLFSDKIEKSLLKLKEKYSSEKDVYTLLADFSIKKNNYNDAANHLEYIIQNFESNDFIWEQLITLYSVQGKFQSMYDKSSIAIDSFPQIASFYLYNGISGLQINKVDEAISSLNQGLKLVEPNSEQEINIFIYLAEAYQEIKNYTQSEFFYEKVLEKQPDNLFAINNYSYYLSLRDQKLEYAEQISRKTVDAEPENSTYLDTYAWILFKLGRYQDALYFIKKAYDYGGYQNDVIVEHYGDILFKTKNITEALKMWELSKMLGNKSLELLDKIEKNK